MPADLDALAAQSGALGWTPAGAPHAAANSLDALAQQSGALAWSDAAARPDSLTGGAPIPDAAGRAMSSALHAAPHELRGFTSRELNAPASFPNPFSPFPTTVGQAEASDDLGNGAHMMSSGVAQIANARNGDERGAGLHQIISGATTAVSKPAMVFGLATAPVQTIAGLVLGAAGQKATEAGLGKLGVSEGYRNAAGDVAGLVAGGLAAHGAGVVGDAVGDLQGVAQMHSTPGGRGLIDLPDRLGSGVSDMLSAAGRAPAALDGVRDRTAEGLRGSAKDDIARALNPTTKINKALTQKEVAQGLADRRVTALTLKHLQEKAQDQMAVYGEQINDAFDAHAEKGTKLDPAPILEKLQEERNAYVVDGVRIDQAYDDVLSSLQDQLKAVAKNNGGEVPVGSLRTIRQIFDKKIARSKGGFALAPDDASRMDALKTYTDAIRGTIADADPELAKLNKEFSFWSNVEKVAGDSVQRKTGQRPALTQTVLENSGMALGASMGGAKGAFVGRTAGKGLGKLANSTIWNTLWASAKMRIADAIARGDEAAAARELNNPANVMPAGATTGLATGAPAEAQSAGANGSDGPAAAPVSPGGSAVVPANGGRGAAQGATATEALPGSGGSEEDAFPGHRIVGKRAVVALPDGSGLRVRYEIREGGSVNATHSPVTFAPNAKSRVRATQPRDYEDPLNHGIVVKRATPAVYNENYSLSSDAPSAGDGPPIAYDQLDDGKPNGQADALSGNERHMVNLRMEKMYPEVFERTYGAGLRDRLAAYGMDTNADLSAVSNPHVFRVVEGRLSPEEMQRVMADTNKSVTKSATATEQMISDSRRVSPQTLNDLAGKVEAFGPSATLAQALEGAAGGDVVQRLIDDGVIAEAERGKYIDPEGKITKEGKLRVSGLTIGRFFTDSEQLREVPTSVRNKLERIAAPLVKVEGDPDWSLTQRVSAALDLIHRARMRGMDNLQDFVTQDGLFASEKYSPEVIHMAELLRAKGNSQELAAGARLYAEDASFAGGGASLLGDTPTPERSFEEHFGKPAPEAVPQTVKSSKAGGVAVAEKPAAAAAPKSQTGFVEAFSLGKGGATKDLYSKLFTKLQNGDLTEAGAPSRLLRAAKPAFDAGEIKSPEDFAAWVQDGKYEKAKAKAPAAVNTKVSTPKPAAPPAKVNIAVKDHVVDRSGKESNAGRKWLSSRTYHLPNDIGGVLEAASGEQKPTLGAPRDVAYFSVDDDQRGNGYGQQLYLRALQDGPLRMKTAGAPDLSADALRVRQALLRKNLAHVTTDPDGTQLLNLGPAPASKSLGDIGKAAADAGALAGRVSTQQRKLPDGGASTIYDLGSGSMQVVVRTDGYRSVSDVLVLPEKDQGRGIGQALYLRALQDGPLLHDKQVGDNLTPAAARVRQKLIDKGLAHVETDDYGHKLLVSGPASKSSKSLADLGK